MKFPRPRGVGPWLVLSSIILAVCVAPFALASGEGGFLKGGERNPGSNASAAYTSETQFIASNGTYGTRQSNKGAGGGAIYGCRSAPGAPPCVRAVNLNQGQAFQFETAGQLGGTITASGGDNAKPFTTNATGVATGLNADRVDSKNADDIATDGATQGAKAAVATVTAGIRFASLDADGKVLSSRGVNTTGTATGTGTAGDGTYTVAFNDDVSACVFTATETTTTDAGAAAVSLGADKKTVTVVTRSGGGTDGTDPTPPTDRPFHLVATCL